MNESLIEEILETERDILRTTCWNPEDKAGHYLLILRFHRLCALATPDELSAVVERGARIRSSFSRAGKAHGVVSATRRRRFVLPSGIMEPWATPPDDGSVQTGMKSES